MNDQDNNFRAAVSRAARDPAVETRFRMVAQRHGEMRRVRIAALGNFEQLREQLNRIKETVLADHERWLARLTEQIAAQGGAVHRATDAAEARRVARQFLRAFTESEVIVAPSGSCVSMVRNHYAALFRDDPAELAAARAIGERTFELTEFLVHRLGQTDLGATFSGRVTYHDSCHLNRELGIKAEPRALLRAVAGLELVELPDSERCCGFGGTFSIKFPEVSAAMARRKAERIVESGADTVVVGDPGCLLQMRGYLSRQGSRVRVRHIAELLAGRT